MTSAFLHRSLAVSVALVILLVYKIAMNGRKRTAKRILGSIK